MFSKFTIHIVVFAALLASCKNDLKEIKELHDNGLISKAYSIDSNGQIQGQLIQFDILGHIYIKENYLNGELEGKRFIYSKDGYVKILENYEKGLLHGTYVEYHVAEQIMIKANYIQGVLKGVLTKYYPSGQIEEEIHFDNNEENGSFREYYPSGNIHWEGNYKNGDNEVGLLYEYSEQGDTIKKMFCDSMSFCKTLWTIDK